MDSKGQTTVEFALTAIAFFAVLFALIDFAVMLYVNLTMQHAVREGARFAITGQGGQTGNQRRAALTNKVRAASNGFYEKNANPHKAPNVSVLTPNGSATLPDSNPVFSIYTGRPVHDTGSPGEVIVVTLAYSWPLLTPMVRPLFPNGRYDFVVRATMRNEPWESR